MNPMTRVMPYLLYEDAGGALEFLAASFGFRERMRLEQDGRVAHAEMDIANDGVILLGSPEAGYRNPKHLGVATQSLYVFVDDVDEHCARARTGGATIIEEPADQDYGDRRYAAEDPEGHVWYFAQPLAKHD